MSLVPGTRFGPYEILAPLGAGGMGEVYRARDTRLKRDVAIKVLPPGMATDPDRLRRFEAEALATAALNHPNILVVFDVGREAEATFVVAELLEGRTLRDVMTAGVVPVRKAIDYATQIAQGLAAAHAKGIVHRDLKPENLFVTAEDRVKILDFGLARSMTASPRADQLDHATQTALAQQTEPGLVLGTIGYMAPEQVRGVAVDHRADIFSFGAVLYELLSGRRAFTGETAADAMTAILTHAPEELAGSRLMPVGLTRVVDRCLEKLPAARFQSASDLAFALESIDGSATGGAGAMAAPVPSRAAWPRTAATLVAGTVLGALVMWQLRPAPAATTPLDITLSIAMPENIGVQPGVNGSGVGGVAVSPDGRSVAFVGRSGEGRRMLYLRSLDDERTRPLDGTEDAVQPFWSADGGKIGFCQGDQLKYRPLAGGPAEAIEPVACFLLRSPQAWRADGMLLGARQANIRTRTADGKTARVLSARDDDSRIAYFAPVWLTDDRFLVSRVPLEPESVNDAGLYLARVGSEELTLVMPGRITAAAIDAGELLVQRGTDLIAQPFDAGTATLSGTARTLATGVRAFSAAGGTVVWWSPASQLMTVTRLARFSRNGERLPHIGPPAIYRDPAVSDDGRRVAVARADDHGQFEIWSYDLVSGVETRVSPFGVVAPVWAPDGQSVASGSGRVWRYRIDRPAKEPLEPAGTDRPPRQITDWSSDGKWLVGRPTSPTAGVVAWPLDGSPGVPVAPGTGRQVGAVFDRSGRWVAFSAADAGPMRVFVAEFQGRGTRIPVGARPGERPRWRRDGREIFYMTTDHEIVAVPVSWPAGGPPSFGRESLLFKVPRLVDGNAIFDVMPDGQTFVVVVEGELDRTPLTVKLRRR